MQKAMYHISPETNRPNICRATIRNCPVGGQHYSSKEEARIAIESSHAKAYGNFPQQLTKTDKLNSYEREVRIFALSLMRKYGLNDWNFEFNRSKRSLGKCTYSTKTISLSKYFVNNNGELDEIEETIKHEIAHALCRPEDGHGPNWRKVALSIGSNGKRTADVEAFSEMKFFIKCPNCGFQHGMLRKPKKGMMERYYCPNCYKSNLGRIRLILLENV